MKNIFSLIIIVFTTSCSNQISEFTILNNLKTRVCKDDNFEDLKLINNSLKSVSSDRTKIYFLLIKSEIETCKNNTKEAEKSLSTISNLLEYFPDLANLACERYIALSEKNAENLNYKEAYRILDEIKCNNNRILQVRDSIYKSEIAHGK
jgi:hypothetical protein